MRELIAKFRLQWARPGFKANSARQTLLVVNESPAEFTATAQKLQTLMAGHATEVLIINIIETAGPAGENTWSLRPGKEKNTFIFPATAAQVVNLSTLESPLLEWQLACIQSPQKIRFDRNYAKFYNFIFLTDKVDAAGRLAFYINMTDKINLQ